MSSSTSLHKNQDDQLWFFVKEDMILPEFMQQHHPYSLIKERGLTLEACLTILKLKGKAKDYAFWIHSASMAAAVRLLSDESILVTYNLYCQRDQVVVIMIRGISDPSPNTSKAPSHENSLQERRKVSRGKLVPELFVQPASRHASGAVDISTMETISDESAMVTINLGFDDSLTFTNEYLVCWINAQLNEGKSLTDIVVHSFGPNSTMRKLQLTTEIWQRSLIRGPWANDFVPMWNDYSKIRHDRESILTKLAQRDANFTQMCQNFIHDLHKFGTDKAAQNRLEKTGHAFYLGKPYFDNSTRDKILSIPTRIGTVQDDLNRLVAKRDKGQVCANHDLAPLYEACLDVKWNKDEGESTALHQQMGGLSLKSPQPESSKGKQLAKKASNLFKSKKKGDDENEGFKKGRR